MGAYSTTYGVGYDRPVEDKDAHFDAIKQGNAARAELERRARGSDLQPQTPAGVREFGTGATRDLDANKLDFEGFLSPLVLERYAEHMHKARRMPDGSMRESDNWQLGIPLGVYIKSLWRHFFAVWKLWRGLPVTEVVKGEVIVKDLETELCALLFNASGMLHETLKAKNEAVQGR
jgi:hypothetical protein